MDLSLEAAGALVRSRGDARPSRAERLRRARRLGATCGRIYLGVRGSQLLGARLPRSAGEPLVRRAHRDGARRAYRTAVELQGLVLKGCQFLGARPDLLPPEWIEALSRLQDRVPPRSFAVVRRVVERELGRRLELVFRRFAPEPVASASLAQVHEAVLHDGRRVAVKVQYPGIDRLVRGDLENLRVLSRTLEWLDGRFDARALVDELGEHVPRELDFLSEAANAERMASLLGDRADVRVPRIVREHTTRRVLVMEFLDGIKITDANALRENGVDPHRVVSTLVEVYLAQILHHGFFHADPHPGNLWVDPSGPGLILLDFGLVQELPPGFRIDLASLVLAAGSGDVGAAAEALERLGVRTRDGSREGLTRLAGWALPLLRHPRRHPWTLEEITALGERIAGRLREDPIVRLPHHVVLLARCVGLLSGVSRALGIRIDPREVAALLTQTPASRASGA